MPDFSRMEFFSAETLMWNSDSEVTDEGLLVGSPVFPWPTPQLCCQNGKAAMSVAMVFFPSSLSYLQLLGRHVVSMI